MGGSTSGPGSAIRRAAAAGSFGASPLRQLRQRTRQLMRRLLRRLVRWPADVHRARWILHRLSDLTDHELRDIGLTRGDLDAVRALPLDADPSAALAQQVEERRGRRPAVPDREGPRRGPP